jgi:beta-lactam-binding protein with PASTA domain
VTVPDVYRTAEAEARKAFTSLGLKVSVSYPIGITPFGLVVRQSVKAGTQIPWGTTVSLEVV